MADITGAVDATPEEKVAYHRRSLADRIHEARSACLELYLNDRCPETAHLLVTLEKAIQRLRAAEPALSMSATAQ